MFIAIVGTPFSGKKAVAEYLVASHGFSVVRLAPSHEHAIASPLAPTWDPSPSRTEIPRSPSSPVEDVTLNNHIHRISTAESFLSMNSPITPGLYSARPPDVMPQASFRDGSGRGNTLWFSSADEMLDFCTRHWHENFVTTDLQRKEVVEEFAIRPFFLLVSVDAPLLTRYKRAVATHNYSLENFVHEHDKRLYGPHVLSSGEHPTSLSSGPLHGLHTLVNIHIVNAFETLAQFYSHLKIVNLMNPDRLRPTWDTYFMRLASLASLRSNCMKRRVGAIIVRNNRIVSTGYNGTPRGLRNCNEGGCARCNGSSPSGQALDECVCLHAEENALLEAGRERVGDGSVLYCNTCPCLRCTVKIIQTGVKEVVYNLSYKVDDASLALFKEAGVKLRRHAPPP